MAMYSGDFEIMGRVERAHHEAALKLKVKRIVMGECGHAFRGAVYDGPKWLGWRDPPVPVIHAVDFYHELITSGRIKIARKFEEPVTVQEPCNIVRGRGLGQKLREIIACDLLGFQAARTGLRAQLLLRSGRRSNQLRASLEDFKGQGKQCQGGATGSNKGPHNHNTLPQLPQRHRRHYQRLQTGHAREILQRNSHADHGNPR